MSIKDYIFGYNNLYTKPLIKNTMSAIININISTWTGTHFETRRRQTEASCHVDQSVRGYGEQDGLCLEVGEVGNRTKTYNDKHFLRITLHQGNERQERNDRT